MSIWIARFYENRGATSPSRIGYIQADSEDEAAEIARKNMGESEWQVDVTRVVLGGSQRLDPADLLS